MGGFEIPMETLGWQYIEKLNIKQEFSQQEFNKYISTFEDIKDVINNINKATINKKIFNHQLASEEFVNPWNSSNFHDFSCFKEALEALEYGTDKYFDLFNYELKKINEYVRKYSIPNKISYKNDIIGFIPIVPNAIIGNPINMINQKRKEKNIPTATIIFEKAVTSRNKSTEMVKFASIIFSLIQILEQKGIRCQVYVSSTFVYDNEIFGYKIKVKNYMQPLNLYKMQFPIISSDMFRRIGFRLLETCQQIKNDGWVDGYGKTLIGTNRYDIENSGEPSRKLKELLDIKNNDIFIPSHEYFDFHYSDNIHKTVKKIIDKTNFNKYINLEER